jgi:hypothetical protein
MQDAQQRNAAKTLERRSSIKSKNRFEPAGSRNRRFDRTKPTKWAPI